MTNDRCINWPCAKDAGHEGPCGTSPDSRTSKELVARLRSVESRGERTIWTDAADEIERLQRRVAEPHPGTGVKCAHCNGSGKEAQVYDEQTGWSDEKACDTCNGSGRITTVEQYLKTLPANWHEDSGLATWFPLVAEEIERLRARIAELEKYKFAVEQHNRECDDLCNNAATCGYKQYFDANGRRCTTCPVDMKINVV